MNRFTDPRDRSSRAYDLFEFCTVRFYCYTTDANVLKDPVSLFGAIHAASLGQQR